ncbi:DUF2281 domain-containing protein [Phormidium sp. CLA17]|uniref:DUF2281 domain-containing protein n=1 Tax=Leptolyngbya sp. Cla-17 TaxID=2803751 RepID=UPI001491DE00|nr:DUF2281 domain-containing protein [Leptolyngbya sp. Cla-17]MBM0742716.1 DUF2281 domain-containing protein [Leptolyngbya sp. Cla-17]
MVTEPTGTPTIDLINSYLELLLEEQHQEIFNLTQSLFMTMLLKKIRTLPANKQCEVLDFIDYLIEKAKDKKPYSGSEFCCPHEL